MLEAPTLLPQQKDTLYDSLQPRQGKNKSVVSEICSQSMGTSGPWDPSLNPDMEVEPGQTMVSQTACWLVIVHSGLDLYFPWPEFLLIFMHLLYN